MPAITNMKNEPAHNQRFEIFVLKVREIHDLQLIFSKQQSPNLNSQKPGRQQESGKTRDREKGKGPRCYKCSKMGHKKSECPEDKPKADTKTTNVEADKKNNPKKLDWNKYVTAKKNSNDSKDMNANCVTVEEDWNEPCLNAFIIPPINNEEYVFEDEFVLDSGAGRHLTNEKKYLRKIRTLSSPLRVRYRTVDSCKPPTSAKWTSKSFPAMKFGATCD